jgi:urease accessory protein
LHPDLKIYESRRMKSAVRNPALSESQGDTFLANRVTARVELVAQAEEGRTLRRHVAEEGSLRLRFPNTHGETLEAVIVNTAGGIAGGDHHTLAISVARDAQAVVTTAAAEKIYRSLGPDAALDVKLAVTSGGRLSWLPQETILFDQCRLNRRIDVDLSGNGALTLAEMVIFGRSAMGERVERGSFVDRWRVRRDGRLLFAETVKLEGLIAEKLASPAVAAGGAAVATILIIPGNDTVASRVRALKDSFAGEVGISAWNGLALVRLCAKDAASVRSDLIAALIALHVPLPRLWLN